MPSPAAGPRGQSSADVPRRCGQQEERATSQRVLLHLDTDPQHSAFDALVAYDLGIERVLHYASVRSSDVPALVQGAAFARSQEDASLTAVFIGGSDLRLTEEVLAAVQASYAGGRRLSVMLDPAGANTAAAAAVARLRRRSDLPGLRVTVLAGSGPVGQRVAGLLTKVGAEVTVSSRRRETAEAACRAIQARFGTLATPAEVSSEDDLLRVLDRADAVLSSGPPGIQLLPERIWRQLPDLRLLADLNAMPPLGVGGIEVDWDGKEREGRQFFGALALGDLKMEVHRACLARMFTRNDLTLDAESILGVADEIEARCAS